MAHTEKKKKDEAECSVCGGMTTSWPKEQHCNGALNRVCHGGDVKKTDIANVINSWVTVSSLPFKYKHSQASLSREE